MANSIMTSMFGNTIEKMTNTIMIGYRKNHIRDIEPEKVKELCRGLVACDYIDCDKNRTILVCDTVTRDDSLATTVGIMGGIAFRLPLASGEWVTLPIIDIRFVSKLTSEEMLALASRLAFATNRLADNDAENCMSWDFMKTLTHAKKIFPFDDPTELNAVIDKAFVEKYPEYRVALRRAITSITPIVEQQSISLILKQLESSRVKASIESFYVHIDREYRARMKVLS